MIYQWIADNFKMLADYIEKKPLTALILVLGVLVFCLGFDHYKADARDDMYWKQQLNNCDSIKELQAERYMERLDRLEYRARLSNRFLDSIIEARQR